MARWLTAVPLSKLGSAPAQHRPAIFGGGQHQLADHHFGCIGKSIICLRRFADNRSTFCIVTLSVVPNPTQGWPSGRALA
jgi:hypothetical protein